MTTHADLSADGTLVFVPYTYGGQIWVVRADTNRALTHGQPEQVTHTDGVLNADPSVSRDGRWLAYAATNPVSGDSSIRLRDLTTGAERQLIEGSGLTSISPDGSRVAYTGFANDKLVTLLIPVAGQV